MYVTDVIKSYVSTHSHPKVAGAKRAEQTIKADRVSTHSHPKVAGPAVAESRSGQAVSTHSHPKVAGRGREKTVADRYVSTHSHPKVAGAIGADEAERMGCFNTQPPEGGWGAIKR